MPSKSDDDTRAVGPGIIKVIQRSGRRLRAFLGPIMGAILLLQGLLVPMLDAGESVRQPAFESRHDTADCPVGHDHTLCVQVGANQAVSSAEVRLHESHVASVEDDLGVLRPLYSATPVLVHGPRGPPIA